MKVGVIGDGGLSKEIVQYLKYMGEEVKIFVSDEYYSGQAYVSKLSEFDFNEYYPLLCFSDTVRKMNVANIMPSNAKWYTFIHPTAQIYTSEPIGEGSIIGPNVVITSDVKIGNHVLLNVSSIVGHNSMIGSFSTINPHGVVSGDCTIGDCVFIGTNATIREKVHIVENSIIGMGSVVVKDIDSTGTYLGVPARRVK